MKSFQCTALLADAKQVNARPNHSPGEYCEKTSLFANHRRHATVKNKAEPYPRNFEKKFSMIGTKSSLVQESKSTTSAAKSKLTQLLLRGSPNPADDHYVPESPT